MKRYVMMSFVALFVSACSSNPPGKPTATHLSAAGVSAFHIEFQGRPTIIIFYAGDFGSSSSHDYNTQDKTFDFSGTIKCTDGPSIEYRFTSENTRILQLVGQAYELDDGGVFRLLPNGSIEQLPFQPMEPSAKRLELMKSYFAPGGPPSLAPSPPADVPASPEAGAAPVGKGSF